MNEEHIVWILLAPVTAQRLTEQVRDFRREYFGPGEKFVEEWDIVECTGDYSAVVNREAGTWYTDEIKLAERLSRELSDPVYTVHVDAAFFGSEGVEMYEGGSYKANVPGDPYEFLRSHGCPSLQKPPLGRRADTIKSVIIVEGATTDAVARALGFDAPPRTPSLSIDEGLLGPVIHSQTIGDLSIFTSRLTKAFPHNDMYEISTGPVLGRFLCMVVRDGENVGVFEYPIEMDETSDGTMARLDIIKGQTTPEGIVAAFGVPLDLLNLG